MSIVVSQLILKSFVQLAMKLEALRDEYMRYATEKCSSVLKEYHLAVETITGLVVL